MTEIYLNGKKTYHDSHGADGPVVHTVFQGDKYVVKVNNGNHFLLPFNKIGPDYCQIMWNGDGKANADLARCLAALTRRKNLTIIQH